jgi:hypothetical protein
MVTLYWEYAIPSVAFATVNTQSNARSDQPSHLIGLTGTSIAQGVVYFDLNGNGMMDPGDPVATSAAVILSPFIPADLMQLVPTGLDLTLHTTTAATGRYSFNINDNPNLHQFTSDQLDSFFAKSTVIAYVSNAVGSTSPNPGQGCVGVACVQMDVSITGNGHIDLGLRFSGFLVQDQAAFSGMGMCA